MFTRLLRCAQCARTTRAIHGPRARSGTARLAAAASTSAWRTARWWRWSRTAARPRRRSASEKGSTCWTWWRREPAAPRRSVVSFYQRSDSVILALKDDHHDFFYLFVCSECNMTICGSEAPSCDTDNRLVMGYSALSCCPEYRCGKKIKQKQQQLSVPWMFCVAVFIWFRSKG